MIVRMAMLIVGAGAVASVVIPHLAHALSKFRVHYQDHPKGSGYCAICVNFIPGSVLGGNGTCTVVEGAISPRGWCVLFAPQLSSNGERRVPRVRGARLR